MNLVNQLKLDTLLPTLLLCTLGFSILISYTEMLIFQIKLTSMMALITGSLMEVSYAEEI